MQPRRAVGWVGTFLLVFGLTTPHLAAQPAGKDQFGDALPAGAIARLGTVRWRHGQYLDHVLYTPDGKLLITGSDDNWIRVWDATTGAQLRTIPGHGRGTTALALSRDGALLASSGADGAVRVHEVATGKVRHTFKTRHSGAVGLAFSPDGKLLGSAGDDSRRRLWDLATGKELHEYEFGGTYGTYQQVAFTPDGKYFLATGREDQWHTVMHEVATGKLVRDFKGTGWHFALTPDGKTLISPHHDKGTSASGVGFWDVATGKLVRTLPFKEASYQPHLLLSPDGQRLALSDHDGQRILDVATGKTLLKAPWGGLRMFSPDGKTLVTVEGWGVLRRWDAATGKEIDPLPAHTWHVTALAFAPDGAAVATGSDDATVRLWEPRTGKPLRQLVAVVEPRPEIDSPGLRINAHWVTDVTFLPGGKALASSGADNAIRLWDVATGKRTHLLPGHRVTYDRVGYARGSVHTVAAAPDGKTLATTGADGVVRLWEVAAGKPCGPEVKAGELFTPRGVRAFFLDGKTLLVVTEREAQLWNTAAAGVVPHFKFPEKVYQAAASAGVKVLATQDEKGDVSLWDVAAARRLHKLPVGWADALALAPDGKTLATGHADGGVRLWDVGTGKELRALRGHAARVGALAFAPDGRLLASGSDDTTALLWGLD
jgi:WD40 repeat protein